MSKHFLVGKPATLAITKHLQGNLNWLGMSVHLGSCTDRQTWQTGKWVEVVVVVVGMIMMELGLVALMESIKTVDLGQNHR